MHEAYFGGVENWKTPIGNAGIHIQINESEFIMTNSFHMGCVN